jgi:hypothetical protein
VNIGSEYDMNRKNKQSKPNPVMLQIVLTFAGTLLVAYFSYLGTKAQVETPIHATQTAEAKLTEPATTITDEPMIATATLTQGTIPVTSSEIFVEDFSKGSQYWKLVTRDGEWNTTSLSITNSALRWQVTGKKTSAPSMGYPTLPITTNIDVEVTLNFVNGSDGIEYGLMFRRSSNLGDYRFMISRRGSFSFQKYSVQDEVSTNLIDWMTPVTPINLNGENKLRVRAIGNNIRLYINNNLVGDIVDDSFSSGIIDVIAFINEGEKLTLDMTSFKLTLISP